MAARLPLSTLLSQVLVAFTIELDNVFEQRMPHWTAAMGRAAAARTSAWLTSLVMWANFLKHVPEEGIPVAQLARAAGVTKPSLAGMARWRYVTVKPPPGDARAKKSLWVVRPTSVGRQAQAVWAPLDVEVEERWARRVGPDPFAGLRAALSALVGRFETRLPDYLPVVGYGYFSAPMLHRAREEALPGTAEALPLSALLSKVLLAFTLQFERESDVSLPTGANVLRLLGEEETAVRDLPRLSGVSKEGLKMALGWLEKRGDVVLGRDAKGKQLLRLTPTGRKAKAAYQRQLEAVEAQWNAHFGQKPMAQLRATLEALVDAAHGEEAPVFQALVPPPDGWRAKLPRPEVLPHHPLVLHRGGYPDGS